MKRVSFRNSRGLNLVGNFFTSSLASIVVMAHGFMSDKSSRGRFERIARSLNEVGYSALAFDFSGCGASDDESLSRAKLEDNLRCAIGYVRSRGFRHIALWGHSLGAGICLRAHTLDVVTMVLTGAGTGPMDYRWERYFSREQLQELAETGRLTERLSDGPRREIVVEAQMLRDFGNVDQAVLLGSVQCPVLLIHGDNDEEEQRLLENTRGGLRYLPEGSTLELIPGANHSFLEHIDRVIDLGRSWLTKHLPLGNE